MANTIELRDAKSLNEFSATVESIKASIPEELHPAIFTRLIIATRGMTAADPCGTPLSIWTIDLDTMDVILALKHLDLSGVSHINPITLIDALTAANPSEYVSVINDLSGTDPNTSIDPKLMVELLQSVCVDVLKFLTKSASAAQSIEWLVDKAKDVLPEGII